jgi:hypothetical protein
MAKVLSFETYRGRKADEAAARVSSESAIREGSQYENARLEDSGWDTTRRDTASSLINKAVDILFEIGEKERKIAWILEDCIDLLLEEGGEMLHESGDHGI